jgi:hypothetical protein
MFNWILTYRYSAKNLFKTFAYGFQAMGKSVMPVIILALLSTMLPGFSKAYASPFELAHDDGNADYGWSDFYPYAAMVGFSPPSQNWRITAIRLHATCILRGAQVFYVQIWDAGLNTVYWSAFLPSSVFKNATLDWYTIQLPNVVVTGDFYVVIVPMFTLDGSQLWISVDDDPPVANTSFIADVDKHAVLASMNATSRRPGDFMVRVVGEPTPTPPELKLSSIDVGKEETIVAFTYPGEVMSMGARLVKRDGSFTEENITRDGQSLIVRVGDEGVLNVFVITLGSEVIGTSIRLETGLRSFYKSLLTNYTVLKAKSDEMRRQLDSLARENEELRLELRDSNILISVLEERVKVLMGNITQQSQQMAGLTRSIEDLRVENRLLLSSTIILAAILLATIVPRMWRFRRK